MEDSDMEDMIVDAVDKLAPPVGGHLYEPFTSPIPFINENGFRDRKCNNCGREAKQFCPKCLDGRADNGDHSPAPYCTFVCKYYHRPAHSEECKVANRRKRVYRMGAIIQEIFYTVRRSVWVDKIVRIERFFAEGRKCMVVTRRKDPADYAKFPDEMFSNFLERHAVLVHGSGRHAINLLGGLVLPLLDVEATLHEVLIRPQGKDMVHFSPAQDRDVQAAEHWFLCLKLFDGSIFAVDFANARFADMPEDMHRQGIIPLGDYFYRLGLTAADIIATRPLAAEPGFTPNGTYNTRTVVRTFRKEVWNYNERDRVLDILATWTVPMAIQLWAMRHHHITLRDVAILSQREYLQAQGELVDQIRWWLDRWRSELSGPEATIESIIVTIYVTYKASVMAARMSGMDDETAYSEPEWERRLDWHDWR